MRCIVLIGNAGTGKPTLSRRIGALLGIEIFHLDSILWKPGWQRASDQEFIAQQSKILRRPAWVIDGLAVWDSIRPRLDKRVIRLRSPRELRRLMADLEAGSMKREA